MANDWHQCECVVVNASAFQVNAAPSVRPQNENRSQHRQQELWVAEWDDGGWVPGARWPFYWCHLLTGSGAASFLCFVAGVDSRGVIPVGLNRPF
jgi:hypothetical protein